MKLIVYVVLLVLLFIGFLMLFAEIKRLRVAEKLFQRGMSEMDEAARRRLLKNRRQLENMRKEYSVWYFIERELHYSGLKRKFPSLTAEMWFAGNIAVIAILTTVFIPLKGVWGNLLAITTFLATEYICLCICKARTFRSVNSNLLKLLDFLGNYSITSGELTGIFRQISKYVDEPLRSVLDECSYEAQTTGDSSIALLAMAEKIEHPKFKELVRNMEVSIRYCADFTTLVRNSRKNMREYLRMGEERKSMIREAFINMSLLLIMSAVTLLTVDGLIRPSVWIILFETWPGRIALGIILFILILFAGKIYRVDH